MNARRIMCKVCQEHWASRRETASTWYNGHFRLHNLVEPSRAEYESDHLYLDRLFEFREKYFEDTLKRSDFD